jgi:hemolysin III
MTHPNKPLMRGVSHQIAFFVALLAGGALVFATQGPRAMTAILVYALSLATLFGISALYHRKNWSPNARMMMRRLDHSAIFLLIAGTYTPVCMLLLEPKVGAMLLGLVWGGAILGIAQSVLWVNAPKAVSATIYVAFGCVILPFLPQTTAALGAVRLALIAGGGILYGLGAMVYALKRPDPWPSVFGYHEIFHALVIAASIAHFVAIASVVLGA